MIELYTKTEFEQTVVRNKLPLECEVCGKTFHIIKRAIVEYKKKGKGGKTCSRQCQGTLINTSQEATCYTCGKLFRRSAYALKRYKHTFCSLSCSAKYANTFLPKRQKTKKCKTCGVLIKSGRVHCDTCKKAIPPEMSTRTIQDVSRYKGSGRYSLVREHARRILNGFLGTCEFCGYSKHTQVCHIKPIKKFDKSSIIGEVNAPMNLLVLCPNCHWELDHELLDD